MREAAAMRILNNRDHPSSVADNRSIFWYLLVGLPLLRGKESGQDLLRVRYNAALLMMGFVALALGILIGSLLDSGFGLAPAVLLDGAVVVVLVALVVLRSIGLLRMRVMRGEVNEEPRGPRKPPRHPQVDRHTCTFQGTRKPTATAGRQGYLYPSGHPYLSRAPLAGLRKVEAYQVRNAFVTFLGRMYGNMRMERDECALYEGSCTALRFKTWPVMETGV